LYRSFNRITTASNKFAADAFLKAIGGASDESHGWKTTVRLARNPKAVGYHLHVYWRQHPENQSQTQLQVDYHRFIPESNEKHSESYAEEFMHWVGKFFEDETLTTHLHGDFEFPIDSWQSKIMALPIKIPYAEKEAVIDGLTIKLPSKPEGVHDVWLQRGSKTLDAFDIVLRTLIEKKQL
jgi:hypothetical protein